ncbi:hypothetical protein TIFTF001_000005 [Ficus carica]|uniref:MADS-box domain-containing protein n=1 Tax=Ficus carica TaxID=3494 RepID=A0AA87ZEC9_FICCA|nr:hypothetical protein TIFTF001_000005 [Ficus carica]
MRIRSKVKLSYITNDKERKASFRKRKKGLIKKATELSTLCGVDACAIIYSPYDPKPEVYPSPAGVQQVLTRFKMMSEMDQTKKMVNQESFLLQRIEKANEQLKKLQRDNREKEITQLMYRSLTNEESVLKGLNIQDLNALSWVIDVKLKEIDMRMERLGKRQMQDDYELQLQRDNVMVQQAAMEVMQGSSGENTATVVAAADRPSGFEAAYFANMQSLQPQPQPQWFLDMVKKDQEQMELGGGDIMLPFRESRQ